MTNISQRIEEIPGESASEWCGCYEGDMFDLFNPRKKKATQAIKSLILDILSELKMKVEKNDKGLTVYECDLCYDTKFHSIFNELHTKLEAIRENLK